MIRTSRLVTAAILSLTVGGVAFAQQMTPQEAAVNARHAHMGLYSFYLTPIGMMAQGQMDYDADIAATAAANLAAMGSIDQAAYWIDGTASGAIEGSRAAQAIWVNPEDFLAARAAFAEATTALAAAAGTDLESLQAAFGPVGAGCGDCHRTFRTRN